MPTRRGITATAIGLALGLAVVGCSSRSSESSSNARDVVTPAGSTAGGSGGWDCGPSCSWDEGASGGGPASPRKSASDGVATGAAGASSTTTPSSGIRPVTPDVSDVPAPPSSGPVTAGSYDDNAQWDEYLRYRQSFDAHPFPVTKIPVEGRQVLTVVDRDGKAVLGADIDVHDGAGKTVAHLRTYADGRALFHPAIAADPNSQQRPTYTATVTKNGATADVRLTPEQRDYTIKLDTPTAAGPVKLDVQFLIDTTGSMGDEIDRLKANVDSVASHIAALPTHPDVHYGMTVYRDRGDLFVTRTFDFTPDEAAFAKALHDVQADGGGDTPEDLNAGLHDALTKPSWRTDPDTVKLVFLVADAPPHLDYPDEVNYGDSVREAAAHGIKILPIAASGMDAGQGEYIFRQLAQITLGRFVFLTYGADGASPGESTPMHVSRDEYSVLPLDELVTKLVTDELSHVQR